MDCQKAERLISLYTDGELKENQEKELIAHTNVCQQCRKEMELTMKVLEELPAYRPPDVSPYFLEGIKAKIAQQRKTVPAYAWVSLSITIIFSFIAGALLGNAYWIQVSNSEPASVEEAKSALKLEAFENYTDGSMGDLYNKVLGGA